VGTFRVQFSFFCDGHLCLAYHKKKIKLWATTKEICGNLESSRFGLIVLVTRVELRAKDMG